MLVSATETKTDPVKFAEVDETVTWTAQFPGGAIAYCTASFKVRGIKNFRATRIAAGLELDPALLLRRHQGRAQATASRCRCPRSTCSPAELDDRLYSLCGSRNVRPASPARKACRTCKISDGDLRVDLAAGRAVKI